MWPLPEENRLTTIIAPNQFGIASDPATAPPAAHSGLAQDADRLLGPAPSGLGPGHNFALLEDESAADRSVTDGNMFAPDLSEMWFSPGPDELANMILCVQCTLPLYDAEADQAPWVTLEDGRQGLLCDICQSLRR